MSGILQFAEYWSGTNMEVYWIAKYIEYWSVQHAEKYCMLKCMEYWNVMKTEVYWILKYMECWSVENTEVYWILNICIIFCLNKTPQFLWSTETESVNSAVTGNIKPASAMNHGKSHTVVGYF